jgi:hypothetical protein
MTVYISLAHKSHLSTKKKYFLESDNNCVHFNPKIYIWNVIISLFYWITWFFQFKSFLFVINYDNKKNTKFITNFLWTNLNSTLLRQQHKPLDKKNKVLLEVKFVNKWRQMSLSKFKIVSLFICSCVLFECKHCFAHILFWRYFFDGVGWIFIFFHHLINFSVKF